ncbi:MAG TPA: hypothetical protein VEG24_05670, partial [Gaiellaceae bacterium]|nr:hypothetical protein [Gaiellaceae bacterium]
LGVVTVLALVLLAGRATNAGAMVVTPAAGAASSFSDPAGDSGGAPDITSVVLSDVPASGTVTFAVTATGLVPSTEVDIYVDTDKNASTGSPSGAEYNLFVWQESDDWGWDIQQWTGTEWTEMPQSSTMNFSRAGDVYTWTVGKADLGGATGFAFYVRGFTFDANGGISAVDTAPDGGRWTYDLTQPAVVVKAVISAPKTLPAVPTAGKRFTVGFAVTRSDTGAPLTSGTMICDPSVSGKVISHAEQFSRGVAVLTFVIPKTAKGKILKVKVTIKLGTQSTTRIANFLVR